MANFILCYKSEHIAHRVHNRNAVKLYINTLGSCYLQDIKLYIVLNSFSSASKSYPLGSTLPE